MYMHLHAYSEFPLFFHFIYPSSLVHSSQFAAPVIDEPHHALLQSSQCATHGIYI